MRVVINTVFLTSERLGGSWSYSYNLLRGLETLNNKADIILLTSSETSKALEAIKLEKIIIPVDPKSRIRRVFWEQTTLPTILKKLNPDVFHSTGNVLPLRSRCKTVVTIHDFQYHYYPQNFPFLRRNYLRFFVPRSIQKADSVICISEYTRQDTLKICNASENKLSVVYEAGLWQGETDSSTPENYIREHYNLKLPFILSVGSSFVHKNLLRLINSFGIAAPEIPQELLIVGEPFGQRHSLTKAVEALPKNVRNRVRFTGFIPRRDLLTLYKLTDAFVFPSLFEGFGIPILEAMDLGCPVIASNSTSLPEVIGNAGLFFDPLNVSDIAESIKKVCLYPSIRENLRQKGFSRASMFSWRRAAEETFNVYEQTI